ncbi:nudix hydrolase 9 isoform X2 [Nymphaea colorata]|uniref:nudix hydrolase 9 isoform X2 n=1 Tax=Nymphaea colorata TaxID=210225 RepID=UPI00129EA528|nr:nudix hydrolase 9 isoform X2 [Nymphaea colorata]
MEEGPEEIGVDPHSYRLVLSCPTGLSRSQVFVDFSAAYDRVPSPNLELEESISKIWDERIQKNPLLYNGKKFRYAGYKFCPAEDGANKEPSVCLQLGLTDYRTFAGTNLSPFWMKFIVHSEDDSTQCQHTSSPLGNGAIVETSDGKILVLQRSCNVGEFPGYFVFPGGHPEPQEIGISGHEDNKAPTEVRVLQERISQEMFEGIIREVVEEIGVPASALSDPLFIGISRRELNVRPTAFFYIKCSMESEEVDRLYHTAQDGYESTQLCIALKNDLEKLALRMPGCHHGGFTLYQLMIEALETSSS